MKLNNLTPAKGSKGREKRIGRGEGSGHGGTSTRGHKGAQARSGYSRKTGFEGGQMPIQRRLPKFGFKNINRREFKPVNLSVIENLAAAKNLQTIGLEEFRQAGLYDGKLPIKVLANGEVTRALSVSAHAFSASAQKAIEAAGGSINKL